MQSRVKQNGSGSPEPLPSTDRPRAGNGTRTRDPNLGKVVLYQLSYSRVTPQNIAEPAHPDKPRAARAHPPSASTRAPASA